MKQTVRLLTLTALSIFLSTRIYAIEPDQNSGGDKTKGSLIVTKENNSLKVNSELKFDAPIYREDINKKGKIIVTGKIKVENGPVSIVMWTKVDGKFYFSQMPELQNIKNGKEVDFSIPFDSLDKTSKFYYLQAILPNGGKFVIENLEVK